MLSRLGVAKVASVDCFRFRVVHYNARFWAGVPPDRQPSLPPLPQPTDSRGSELRLADVTEAVLEDQEMETPVYDLSERS